MKAQINNDLLKNAKQFTVHIQNYEIADQLRDIEKNYFDFPKLAFDEGKFLNSLDIIFEKYKEELKPFIRERNLIKLLD